VEPIELFRIELPQVEVERVSAELHSLGTHGIEERVGPRDSGLELLAYFAVSAARAPRVLALASDEREIRVHGPEPVPEVDWEREWRKGLHPRRVGALWIRPSWCESVGSPELLIDPQQAFGSGEHASTRLALGLLLDILEPGDRLLDVGTGSGILALAALRLGAARACGLDTDRTACANALENARRNRLPLQLVCGDIEALAAVRFEVVVANMLIRELLPCLPRLLGAASRALVLSGYLEEEGPRLEQGLLYADWQTLREEVEEQSGDRWCARLLGHTRFRQSSRMSAMV
jgi:ribosomal protein L11 methyltransferase